MKRREWLKSLLCAPLAMFAGKSLSSPPESIHLDYWWSDDPEAFEALRNAVAERITIEHPLMQEPQLEASVLRAINNLNRRGRIDL